MSFSEGKPYDKGFRVDANDTAISESPGLDGFKAHTYIQLPGGVEIDHTFTTGQKPPCEDFAVKLSRWLEVSLNTGHLSVDQLPTFLSAGRLTIICEENYLA